jgi:hypothetical protein
MIISPELRKAIRDQQSRIQGLPTATTPATVNKERRKLADLYAQAGLQRNGQPYGATPAVTKIQVVTPAQLQPEEGSYQFPQNWATQPKQSRPDSSPGNLESQYPPLLRQKSGPNSYGLGLDTATSLQQGPPGSLSSSMSKKILDAKRQLASANPRNMEAAMAEYDLSYPAASPVERLRVKTAIQARLVNNPIVRIAVANGESLYRAAFLKGAEYDAKARSDHSNFDVEYRQDRAFHGAAPPPAAGTTRSVQPGVPQRIRYTVDENALRRAGVKDVEIASAKAMADLLNDDP